MNFTRHKKFPLLFVLITGLFFYFLIFFSLAKSNAQRIRGELGKLYLTEMNMETIVSVKDGGTGDFTKYRTIKYFKTSDDDKYYPFVLELFDASIKPAVGDIISKDSISTKFILSRNGKIIESEFEKVKPLSEHMDFITLLFMPITILIVIIIYLSIPQEELEKILKFK